MSRAVSTFRQQLTAGSICTAEAVVKGKEESYRHITHVLSLHSGRKPYYDFLLPTPATRHIIQKQIILEDEADINLLEYFPEICHFIHSALASQKTPEGCTVNLLVHCRAGISRSATAVISYLVWTHCSVEAAVDFLIRQRYGVNPNPGFIKRLELWSKLGCDLYLNGSVHPDYKIAVGNDWTRKRRMSKPDMQALTNSFYRPSKDHRWKSDHCVDRENHFDPRAWCALHCKLEKDIANSSCAIPAAVAETDVLVTEKRGTDFEEKEAKKIDPTSFDRNPEKERCIVLEPLI